MDNEEIKCRFMSDTVSYLYGEMPPAARLTFEKHLAGCESCTDEFAAISYSRFSVLEWQLGEFADLPTPRIEIPYETARSTGWLEAARGLFTIPGFGAALTAAALFLIVGGVYLGFYSGVKPQGTVAVAPARVEQQVAPTEVKVETPVSTDIASEKTSLKVAQKTATIPSPRPFRAVVKERGPKPVRVLQANLNDKIKPTMPEVKAPVLSSFDDEDDNTLRLADLLDDGGV